MEISVLMKISASTRTETTEESIDLVNGKYELAAKPIEIFIERESSKKGPTLEELQKKRIENSEKSGQFMASDKLARYAMKNLVST
jgi:hypothetical protein